MFRIRTLSAVLCLMLTAGTSLLAQDRVEIIDAPGTPASTSSPPGSPPVRPPSRDAGASSTKPGDDKKEEDGKKDTEGGEKEGTDAAPPIIRRSDVPADAESAATLNMQLDASGKVRFNVEGAPWLTVLKWLADISHLSLDWQELPGDYLNLRTQDTYTIEEAQDVINRHLLARGFTMLKHGEVLSVVNISQINPGLVPRVSADDLDSRQPHEFVKVSFPLDWMLADEAVTELTPMRSPNGTLTALKSTNRIEAMDAVVNLREIHALLQQEQSAEGETTVIKVFNLKHVRAQEVIMLLEGILGLDSNRMMGGNLPDSMGQQIMRQLQEMQRNMSNSRNSGSNSGSGKEAQRNPN